MDAQSPLLSIITVTKDNLAGLQKTAASLNGFDESLVEWLVIDGGSRGGTAEFLSESSAGWISESDDGLYDAMNKGIEKARGEYLLFLNAGDTLTSAHTLSNLIPVLEKKELDFLYADALEDTPQGQFFKKARSHKRLAWGMFTHHQAMVYRQKLLANLRYDTRYCIAADYDFTCRFLDKSKNVLHFPQPICVFESGGVSQTNAMQGRQEQFEIRENLKLVPAWKNYLIYSAQSLSWTLRSVFPVSFWRLRRLWPPCGNSAYGSSQIQSQPPRP